MNVNTINHFSKAAVDLDIQRSVFDRSHSHKTTFNVGDLVPILCDEVLPGDTHTIKSTNYVMRLSTPLFPTMDNLFADIFYFFVPSRILWENWDEFNGENKTNYWTVPSQKIVPYYDGADLDNKPIADYLGCLPFTEFMEISALPIRGYYEIWNEWFRNQNVSSPLLVPKTDAKGSVPNNGNLCKVTKYPDYFTTALPAPQKGANVSISTVVPGVGNGNTASTVTNLRLAFQLQKLLEKDARGGTRYFEMLKSHFGVTSPDSRLQRPEFIGSHKIPINISQVVQMSSSDGTSPQGHVAGMSHTAGQARGMTYSAVEHGYLYGLVCVRQVHSYQSSIDKHFFRFRRFDYYYPTLANIGEQPIRTKEIFNTAGHDSELEHIFGWQEAWADYRYKLSKVSGKFRTTPIGGGSLDSWHYSDHYTSEPLLNSLWMAETPTNVDRTLAVQSAVHPQIIADFYFNLISARPMPTYSIPGLVDHH